MALLAGAVDRILLHTPRSEGALRRTAIRLADRVVVVATDDVFSLYGVRSLLAADEVSKDRVVIVRNRGRRRASGRDFEVVAGLRASAAVRADRRVPGGQNRGELLGRRARGAAADIRRLAAELADAGVETAR